MWKSGVFGYLLDYALWWILFLSLVSHTWCFFRFFPRQTRPRAALVLGNALLFACFLGAAALVGESYYRFFSIRTDSFGVSLPARRWFLMYTELNSLGFRDKEWAIPKPDGVRRIALVGDSFTYGWGIERSGDRFTGLLQARFDARSPGRMEVMNVAKAGWGTEEELAATAELVPRYAVDEIVLCYVLNDLESLIPKPDGPDPTRPPEPALFNPDASCLLDHLYRRVYLPRLPSVRGYFDWLARGYEDPAVWARQVEQFRQLAGFCASNQVTLRAVLLPNIRSNEPEREKRYLERVAGAMESMGVQTVDLSAVTAGLSPSSLVVNSVDPHPNETAHALFADRIWEAFYGPAARSSGRQP